MNASNFPWVILVPRIPNISELFHLDTKERLDFQMEVDFLLEGMSKVYEAHKMNTASLGNLVPQLHTHIIVRYKNDDAWPSPVWSFGNMAKYTEDGSKVQIDKLRNLVDDYRQGENNE
jgi:diadenosine tetraphosphate (Ap4A) HIT family hydrolase